MLTNLSQIKGGLVLRSDVNALQAWKEALTAAGIDTSILGTNEANLSVQDVLNLIIGNANIQGATPTNLETLQAAVNTINNKQIKDFVKTDLTIAYSAGSYSVDVSGVDAGLKTADNDSLPVYTSDGRVVYANENGTAQLTINMTTGALSGTPYLMDDKTADRDADPAETEAGVSKHYAVTSDLAIKVFPVGTFTFGTLPANALLDNSEMKSLAYDQAIDSIVKKIATDEDIVHAIAVLVGDEAVSAQITRITDTLYRFSSIVGTAAQGEEGDADYVAAEEITATTPVYSKNKVDEIIANLNSDSTAELNKKYEFANINTAAASAAVTGVSTFGAVDYVAPLAGVTAEGAATKSTPVDSTVVVDHKIAAAVKAALDTASAGVYALDLKTYDWNHIVGAQAAAAIGESGDVGYVPAVSAETVNEATAVYSKLAVDQIKDVLKSDIDINEAAALANAKNNATRIDDILTVYKPVVETVAVISPTAVTTFNLTNTPTDTLVKMYVNGMIYFEGDEFTVDRVNNTVTWSFVASNEAGHIEGTDGFSITNAVTNKVRFEYFTGVVTARTVPTA